MEGHERAPHVNLDSLNQFSNYWEIMREYYYPFESELRSGTAEVYKHEIPGGQYSNLLPQARSLGLEDRFEQIKINYSLVNQMFGNIVKVTPSSKVVGDMALFMTSNNLTPEDVMKKGAELAFPESVKNLFRGNLGQPYQGFPRELQKLVLKGEEAFTDRPNQHLEEINFEAEFKEFKEIFDDRRMTFLDFLSYKLYPKVFSTYYAHLMTYDEVMKIPTSAFFFPMKPNEEILVRIAPGKKLLIQYMYQSEPDEEGMRMVFFKINGQTRSVKIRDRAVHVEKQVHRKADVDTETEIGCPLQGKLTRILVEEGDTVEKNQPLFVIEAMKMESTVSAPMAGTVRKLYLKEDTMVEQDDLVIELENK